MLIGIDGAMTPDLLFTLARMGHGDEIVVADANFPIHSTASRCIVPKPIDLAGADAPEAVRLITTVMPVETFTPIGAWRMEIDDAPDEMGAVHTDTFAVLEAVKPADATLGSLERQDFYAQANRAFAVVATSERRPFGCFIIRKGVVFD